VRPGPNVPARLLSAAIPYSHVLLEQRRARILDDEGELARHEGRTVSVDLRSEQVACVARRAQQRSVRRGVREGTLRLRCRNVAAPPWLVVLMGALVLAGGVYVTATLTGQAAAGPSGVSVLDALTVAAALVLGSLFMIVPAVVLVPAWRRSRAVRRCVITSGGLEPITPALQGPLSWRDVRSVRWQSGTVLVEWSTGERLRLAAGSRERAALERLLGAPLGRARAEAAYWRRAALRLGVVYVLCVAALAAAWHWVVVPAGVAPRPTWQVVLGMLVLPAQLAVLLLAQVLPERSWRRSRARARRRRAAPAPE